MPTGQGWMKTSNGSIWKSGMGAMRSLMNMNARLCSMFSMSQEESWPEQDISVKSAPVRPSGGPSPKSDSFPLLTPSTVYQCPRCSKAYMTYSMNSSMPTSIAVILQICPSCSIEPLQESSQKRCEPALEIG